MQVVAIRIVQLLRERWTTEEMAPENLRQVGVLGVQWAGDAQEYVTEAGTSAQQLRFQLWIALRGATAMEVQNTLDDVAAYIASRLPIVAHTTSFRYMLDDIVSQQTDIDTTVTPVRGLLRLQFAGIAIAVSSAPTGTGTCCPQRYDFTTPQQVWVVNHMLGRPVHVQVYTVGGYLMLSGVKQEDSNTVRIEHNGNMSGYVVVG